MFIEFFLLNQSCYFCLDTKVTKKIKASNYLAVVHGLHVAQIKGSATGSPSTKFWPVLICAFHVHPILLTRQLIQCRLVVLHKPSAFAFCVLPAKLDYLSQKYIQQPVDSNSSKNKSILDSSFFGMWKDREEMQDSSSWVRKVRKSRWAK